MRLDEHKLSILIWTLHYRYQYSLKSISQVLKMPYWKTKDMNAEYEYSLSSKIAAYRAELKQYKRDKRKLRSLIWRLARWLGLWFPASEPDKPNLIPMQSNEFKQELERVAKRLERIRQVNTKSRKVESRKIQPSLQNPEDLLKYMMMKLKL